MKSLFAIIGMILVSPILVILTLLTMRFFGESRYLPTDSMQPALKKNDRVLIEKISTYLKRPYIRGEIIVFYPPPVEMNGHDLNSDPLTILGRLTGLPFLPFEPAFIKRVIGLPGDRIQISKKQGILVNGRQLDESSYLKELPTYDLNILGDIGGQTVNGNMIHPYSKANDAGNPIIVPPGQLFVLGDHRNNGDDSHVFGMVKDDRVIGRVQVKYFPQIAIIDQPKY